MQWLFGSSIMFLMLPPSSPREPTWLRNDYLLGEEIHQPRGHILFLNPHMGEQRWLFAVVKNSWA